MRQYTVTGMTCAACQSHVEKAVAKVPGVSSVAVALLTNSMAVDGTASNEEIIRAVENAGYGARLKGEEKKKSSASEKLAQEAEALADHETPKLKRRLIWSAVFLALLMYITMGHNMLGWPVPAFFDHNHLGLALTEMFLALIVMYVNKDFFLSGGKSLAHGAPNMDTLVALGSGVSFLWSLYVLYEMTYLLTQGTSNADLMGFYHDRLYFDSCSHHRRENTGIPLQRPDHRCFEKSDEDGAEDGVHRKKRAGSIRCHRRGAAGRYLCRKTGRNHSRRRRDYRRYDSGG